MLNVGRRCEEGQRGRFTNDKRTSGGEVEGVKKRIYRGDEEKKKKQNNFTQKQAGNLHE